MVHWSTSLQWINLLICFLEKEFHVELLVLYCLKQGGLQVAIRQGVWCWLKFHKQPSSFSKFSALLRKIHIFWEPNAFQTDISTTLFNFNITYYWKQSSPHVSPSSYVSCHDEEPFLVFFSLDLIAVVKSTKCCMAIELTKGKVYMFEYVLPWDILWLNQTYKFSFTQ